MCIWIIETQHSYEIIYERPIRNDYNDFIKSIFPKRYPVIKFE